MKTNFEEAYQRAIKHWRPRPTRNDTLQFSDASCARRIARAQGVIPGKNRGPSTRSRQGVESHYQPFPRQIHSSFLWPKRKPTPAYIAPETKAAMKKWPTSDASDASDTSDTPDTEEIEDALKADRSDPSSKRRRSFSMNPPARRGSSLPSNHGTTPARFRKVPASAQSGSPKTTSAHQLRTASAPTIIPLRLANANPKIQPTMPQPSALRTPSRLRRRSEVRTPSVATENTEKKRRSSVYDFEDLENDVRTPLRKRSKNSDTRDSGDLDLPHHVSAMAGDE